MLGKVERNEADEIKSDVFVKILVNWVVCGAACVALFSFLPEVIGNP